jgi:hypothetical protein
MVMWLFTNRSIFSSDKDQIRYFDLTNRDPHATRMSTVDVTRPGRRAGSAAPPRPRPSSGTPTRARTARQVQLVRTIRRTGHWQERQDVLGDRIRYPVPSSTSCPRPRCRSMMNRCSQISRIRSVASSSTTVIAHLGSRITYWSKTVPSASSSEAMLSLIRGFSSTVR